ncbi:MULTISPECIES: DUF2982 domain-containing protein [unclassified Photobacterium]|uniref:DUF2982 domain-containing protein n=1 Tax=unclassified Photobacterium TaxID=2628852 RepID=UPI001EE006A9|nr:MULTISPECIES: DUF2982 domain-containing protein [unclassified Photobacterium]MCG3862898.1 DUF2982 domain-containing protein [Photobacterium sp. Ph6]MCG3874429.1 DUF2982 domain-containing protein [Photobacterium sp. Ph5]
METYHVKSAPITPYVMLFVFCFTASISGCFFSFFIPSLTLTTTLITASIVGIIAVIVIRLICDSKYLFTLTFMHCQYHSRYGGWSTPWYNISQLGKAEINHHGWQQPLPWIGIKLNNYDDFIQNISPRLAARMIIEQRILLVMAIKNSNVENHTIEDVLFDDEPYQTPNGNIFKGLRAMLAHRMEYNRKFLGFDFFISEDTLDRPINDFIGLLRRYKAAAIHQ